MILARLLSTILERSGEFLDDWRKQMLHLPSKKIPVTPGPDIEGRAGGAIHFAH